MKEGFVSCRLDSDSTIAPRLVESRTFGNGARGFTLIELMVAIAVLALLVALVAQLTNNVTKIVKISDQRMDSESEAQLVFSRMAEDIEGRDRRPDADCFFVKNTGNDAFYFYSQSSGYQPDPTDEGPASLFSFVGYRISNRGPAATAVCPNGQLERVGIRMGYDTPTTTIQTGKIMKLLSYSTLPTAAVPNPAPISQSTIAYSQGGSGNPAYGNEIGSSPTWDNPTYQVYNQAVLSSRVFRLEFYFILDDGTYFVPGAPGSTPWGVAGADAPFMDDMTTIKTHAVAMVVTIALLDQNSQLIVPQSAPNMPNFTTAIAALADVSITASTHAAASTVTPPAATWNTKVQNALASPSTCMATLGMPPAAATQIRIYQRTIPFKP